MNIRMKPNTLHKQLQFQHNTLQRTRLKAGLWVNYALILMTLGELCSSAGDLQILKARFYCGNGLS